MKDNFLIKKYQQEVFNELSDEDAGKLIKGIFKYVNTGNSELEGYLKSIRHLQEKYKDQITGYMATHRDTKLENPINIGSPTQLAELFYDILKVDPPDKRNPRGTGVDILKAMKHPLCDLILDYRGTQKLLSTYIDKLPEALNKNTHKLHAAFKQYGTDTGRYASADPNLQNIPIRIKMGCCRAFILQHP